MSRRRRGRTIDEDYYEEEHYERRPAREPVRERRERVIEEDVEVHRRPATTRFREVDKDIFKERIRSSSAGPLVLRPRVSDEFVHVPRETEREIDEIRITHPRGRERRPPPVDIEVDEQIVHRREKSRPRELAPRFEEDEIIIHERDYDSDHFSRPRRRATGHSHKMDVEIDHGRHKDEIIYHSISRERPVKAEEREDILIRTEEKRGRGRELERDEVLIRKNVERSSSSESSIAPSRSIHAPPIHQDVITHHRHIDHGYEIAPPRTRPRAQSTKRVEIDEVDVRERRGRGIDDLEVIHRRDRGYESSPSPLRRRRFSDAVRVSHSTTRGSGREHDRDVLVVREKNKDPRDRADIMEEAEYYNHRATAGAPIGEAYNGATRDWSIIDVPPGTKRVTLDGVGGANQEITWQRYNGVRRSKFRVDGDEYASDFEIGREKPTIGRRYRGVKNVKDRLWTEITKDLVVKEAIERAGYEYEETEDFYYVFSYLRYDDVAYLVRMSEDFRRARRERIREIQAERAVRPPPVLALPAPPQHSTTVLVDRTTRERDEEFISERDVIVETDRRAFRGRRW
ncbi:hypothetical protein PRK78_001426 [Emydomyces testavorans]|uniref:DUF8035 domain-containing protein n=1 Tax=Emydomyces testavorans TaxID=2070801 RepID=A0AAF0IGU7_9EURO|nr:hypothetical protein PRK78_001426 [Emydomyces testavorans]